MTEQVGEAVPASQRGTWTSFLKSIATFSGDLSALTAPSFILSPVSLTEFPAYWCEHPHMFSAIADGKTQQDRALLVLKWFISTLKGSYTSRNESMGSEKKPLNPVLGELFYGTWPASPSCKTETNLLVEQVSHHPPVTAYVIRNFENVVGDGKNGTKKGQRYEKERVRLAGHSGQKTSFTSGSIMVRQVGHAILTVTLPDGSPEQYLITLPKLRIDGLWYGSPYIELIESSWIASSGSEGWLAQIDYKGKGYFSGKSHSFKAVVSPAMIDGSNESLTIEGTWHTTSKFSTGQIFHDVTGLKREVAVRGGGRIVPKGEKGASGEKEGEREMGEWETRRLWAKVANGIREGDFEAASREKSRIENDQRQRRKDEAAAGTTWQLKHFNHIEEDTVYARLGEIFNVTPPTEDAYVFKNNWPWS